MNNDRFLVTKSYVTIGTMLDSVERGAGNIEWCESDIAILERVLVLAKAQCRASDSAEQPANIPPSCLMCRFAGSCTMKRDGRTCREYQHAVEVQQQ